MSLWALGGLRQRGSSGNHFPQLWRALQPGSAARAPPATAPAIDRESVPMDLIVIGFFSVWALGIGLICGLGPPVSLNLVESRDCHLCAVIVSKQIGDSRASRFVRVAELRRRARLVARNAGGRCRRAQVSILDCPSDRLHADRGNSDREGCGTIWGGFPKARGLSGYCRLCSEARADPLLLLASGSGREPCADDDGADRVDRGLCDLR